MKRTPLAAALAATTVLGGCRQLVGLDDRPGVHDAGVAFTSVPVDAATPPDFCTTTDASFCDDFESEGLAEAGWTETIGKVDDAGVGTLVVGSDGALRATGIALPTAGFNDARIDRGFATNAQRVTLSFSISLPAPRFANEDDLVQLAALKVPGSIVYPAISQRGLFFGYTTTNGTYVMHDSETFFGFDVWHRMNLVFDLAQKTVAADIDGKTALTAASFEPFGNTGEYRIAIGLRMQGNTTGIDVRYDDVVVELR